MQRLIGQQYKGVGWYYRNVVTPWGYWNSVWTEKTIRPWLRKQKRA